MKLLTLLAFNQPGLYKHQEHYLEIVNMVTNYCINYVLLTLMSQIEGVKRLQSRVFKQSNQAFREKIILNAILGEKQPRRFNFKLQSIYKIFGCPCVVLSYEHVKIKSSCL